MEEGVKRRAYVNWHVWFGRGVNLKKEGWGLADINLVCVGGGGRGGGAVWNRPADSRRNIQTERDRVTETHREIKREEEEEVEGGGGRNEKRRARDMGLDITIVTAVGGRILMMIIINLHSLNCSTHLSYK